MGKPHVHAEFIKKWADGVDIQYYDKHDNEWIDSGVPVWNTGTQYRVKPVTIRYRIAILLQHGNYTACVVRSDEEAKIIQDLDIFIRWDGDWVASVIQE